MSRYAYDRRVSQYLGVSDMAYDVTTPDGDRYVYRDNGEWMTSAWRKDAEVLGPFPTADDAIRSLIGDPQS